VARVSQALRWSTWRAARGFNMIETIKMDLVDENALFSLATADKSLACKWSQPLGLWGPSGPQQK
jgi:hypothetical protein